MDVKKTFCEIFTSNSRSLTNQQLVKYTSFINNFFREVSTSNVYVERVMDGFLVFFESWDHFARSFQPYAEKFHDVAENASSSNGFVMSLGPSKESFPKKGLELCLIPPSGPKEKMKRIIEDFYKNLKSKAVVSMENDGIAVLFENYENLTYYINLFMAVMEEKYTRA